MVVEEEKPEPQSWGGCCCHVLKKSLAAERFDFLLDGQMWKEVYTSTTCLCPCLPKCALLAIRCILALLWLGAVIWSIVAWAEGTPFGYWLTKLTHWSALLELAYLFFAAGATFAAVYGRDADGTGSATPWFVSVTWALYTFVPTVAFLVLVLYWALVYNPANPISAISVIMHGGNFAVVILDLLIFQQPFYFAHIYMPFLMASLYVLFTGIYYVAGGTYEDGQSRYIYKAVDWSNPSATGSLMGLIVLLGVPGVYALLLCVFSHWCPCCRRAPQAQNSSSGEGGAQA